ncbi:DUF5641 domain-containing protein [Caenorhabditis elegans]|uniref:DUF5641 domain-containing protein n=1 Tax=Caenorhabditis elegans TaxID=6239 RepID=Q4W5M1_CAEEL|nr:DUF5641 domain-containing protein [Caenorhabditis elegans]CCD73420.1 DUF5641 domain-containing protein [Caenorhabditis elegans]|eukprot:NP_001021736.1 Uncharacterized protein CELE_Y20F4.8 [Caenorhabditis elegans]
MTHCGPFHCVPARSFSNFTRDLVFVIPCERLVALIKNVLYKVLGKQVVTILELETLVIETEGIINSRPITPNKKDPDDAPAIRPADFISYNAQLTRPEHHKSIFEAIQGGESGKLTRQLMEKLRIIKEQLWKEFSKSYIAALRDVEHHKKATSRLKPEIGQVVLVFQKLLPRYAWPMARIVELNRKNPDGEVQSVMVKMGKRIVEKPVNLLIPLENTGIRIQVAQEEEGPDDDVAVEDVDAADEQEAGTAKNPEEDIPKEGAVTEEQDVNVDKDPEEEREDGRAHLKRAAKTRPLRIPAKFREFSFPGVSRRTALREGKKEEIDNRVRRSAFASTEMRQNVRFKY